MKSLLFDIFGAYSLKGFVREYGWRAIVFSLILVGPIVGFFPAMPQAILYVVLGVTAIWSLSKAVWYCTPILSLLCYIPIEILLSGAPSFFSPWMRYILFAFVLMSVSSLFGGEQLGDFRAKVFRLTVIWCVLLGAGSFVARFMGINYMKTLLINSTVIGDFGGLTNHSMLLGPVSGISTIYLIYKFLMTQHKLLLVFAVMSIGCVMFSASRSALIATVAGLIVLFYLMNRSSKTVIKYVLLFALAGTVSFPYWSDILIRGFVAKNQGMTTGLSTSSRDSKWENRIAEFESSPLFGVGFSTVDLNNYEDYAQDGGIETGSSWLSVLSMTGIIGAALMFWILLKAVFNVHNQRKPEAALICGILALFATGMMAEGYIFSGGSFLCITFWLVLGQAYDCQ